MGARVMCKTCIIAWYARHQVESFHGRNHALYSHPLRITSLHLGRCDSSFRWYHSSHRSWLGDCVDWHVEQSSLVEMKWREGGHSDGGGCFGLIDPSSPLCACDLGIVLDGTLCSSLQLQLYPASGRHVGTCRFHLSGCQGPPNTFFVSLTFHFVGKISGQIRGAESQMNRESRKTLYIGSGSKGYCLTRSSYDGDDEYIPRSVCVAFLQAGADSQVVSFL